MPPRRGTVREATPTIITAARQVRGEPEEPLFEEPPERPDQDCAPTPAPEDLYARERDSAPELVFAPTPRVRGTSRFAVRQEPERYDLIAWHLDTGSSDTLISACPQCASMKVVRINLNGTNHCNCLRCRLAWGDPIYVPQAQVAEVRGYYGAPEA